jgi:para-aminobenzoate synthetase/4-amino-4-deoxychorismate lyase
MKVVTQFEKKPLLFQNPEFIISCSNPSSFNACFRDIESALSRGYYMAGFFSYEAGYCFEEKLLENKAYDFPLIHMGAYKTPLRDKLNVKIKPFQNNLSDIRINISQDNYFSDINTIRDYIAEGDVYQITYCIKLLFNFKGDPLSFYAELLKEQPVPYPAYIETNEFNILSLSPEMFIKKKSSHMVTKPMKGTWPRGNNVISDFIAPFRLKYDGKNRAENVMIADLLRNDLGRVGAGIKAPKLFETAKYATLCQMTSTVTGNVDKNVGIYDIFRSLFPSGSVTGAPKIRAMEIIRGLEKEERKIYTGAIGYITPDRDMFFNIPIRTLLIRDGKGEMGIGGGIVWDSTPQGEWDEGMLKAKFLTG